jgi:hypothetical protein
MSARFIEEEDTNKVNDRISHLLNTYYSDEDDIQEETKPSAVVETQVVPPPRQEIRQRAPASQPAREVPEFDLSKIVGAFTSMMKSKEKPKPKVQNYITKMYDIVVGYLLTIIHFILPEDMVAPAEGLIKGRLSMMVQEEILELQEDHKYFYKFVLGLCCILYYAYQSRILLAFINGFFWGAYLL